MVSIIAHTRGFAKSDMDQILASGIMWYCPVQEEPITANTK